MVIGRLNEDTSKLREYKVLVVKRVRSTCDQIKKVSKENFSAKIGPKKGRISIFLQLLGDIQTSTNPFDVTNELKLYLFRVLRDEGVEVEREKVEKLLDSILKDFLEDIFVIAEEKGIRLPEKYEKLYNDF